MPRTPSVEPPPPRTLPDDGPGGRVVGGCRLLRRLSAGGMGEVYLAQQLRLGNRRVAVKIVRPDEVAADATDGGDTRAVERRFLREGALLGGLAHPNILPVHDSGLDGGCLFLVMQYAPDGSLADAIKGRGSRRLRLPVSVPFAADLIGQVAAALQFTHDHGIVHRDVKPGNVLVQAQADGRWHVMLADFGIARGVESTAQAHQITGTVAYMAPEQLSGRFSPASDQYALGVLAYLLLTGRTPFLGGISDQARGHLYETPPPMRALNSAVPLELAEVVCRALNKNPAERWPSVAAFAGAFRSAAALAGADTAVATPPPPAAPPAAPPPPPATPHPSPAPQRPATPPTEPTPRRAAGPVYVMPPGASATRRAGDDRARAAKDGNGKDAHGRAGNGAGAENAVAPATALPALAPKAAGHVEPRAVLASGTTEMATRGLPSDAEATQPSVRRVVVAARGLSTRQASRRALAWTRRDEHRRRLAISAATAALLLVAIVAAIQSKAPGTSRGSPPPRHTTAAGMGPTTGGTGTPSTRPAPPDQAAVAAINAPPSVIAGQIETMTLTFTNMGTSTWSNAAGYALVCDVAPHPDAACRGFPVVALGGRSIAPGQSLTFTLRIKAPGAPGSYHTYWSLARNGHVFGTPDAQITLNVQPAPTATPIALPTPVPSPTATPSPTPRPKHKHRHWPWP